MRLTLETQPIDRYRRRGGASTAGDNPFYTEFFSTNNNSFFPFYVVHKLYARTPVEIIYRIPWIKLMPPTLGRWADVGISLQKSPIMRNVVINGRRTDIWVCKGFACRVTEQGELIPLFVVATMELDELFRIGKNKSVNDKKFVLIQSKDFMENVDYKNLRSQMRKIYINPLVSRGMNTLIAHDINELVFNPVKLQMKFGSVEALGDELDKLKKSVCPKAPKVKMKATSQFEEHRSAMHNMFADSLRDVRDTPSTVFSIDDTGSPTATTAAGNPPDGTVSYDSNTGNARIWSEVRQQWMPMAGVDPINTTNTNPIPQPSSEEINRIRSGISTFEELADTIRPVVISDNEFIDRIMNEAVEREGGEDDDAALPF